MTRVCILVPDLLFGSKVQGMLSAGGHDVALVAGAPAVRAQIASTDVLVVDLTNGDAEAIALLDELKAAGDVPRTLAFYSHVDADVRTRAMQAGFDLVVPRSRMAREGSALVDRLVG